MIYVAEHDRWSRRFCVQHKRRGTWHPLGAAPGRGDQGLSEVMAGFASLDFKPLKGAHC